MISKEKIHELLIRANEIRDHVIDMTCAAKSGHPGGSLSIAEIVSILYFYWMKIDPKKPNWEGRDYFVLSKGHAVPALYAALAGRGYFPKSYLKSLRQIGSGLQGHPDKRSLPGIEMSTGSLGQGLSIMVGMSLALKLDNKKNRIFGIIGDGESQEGQIWEASMAASHYKCDNLVVFLDKNGLQIDGTTEEIMNINPAVEKWQSFGWEVISVNGHNILEIVTALEKADNVKEKPTMIISQSVKGKGVSFMENQLGFHGSPCSIEQLPVAKREIQQSINILQDKIK